MRKITMPSVMTMAALVSAAMPCRAPAQGTASGWWYAGRTGQAPQRQLVFVDRATVRVQRGEASVRVMHVFEQPRGDVRAFAITYGFRCTARRYQSRDAVFSTTANTQEPERGVVDDWSAVAPNSVAALVLDAACFGRFDSAARRIAGAPLAEADAMFRSPTDGAPQVAAAIPRGGGLMPRDQLARCLNGKGQATPACQEARASAARGRAARLGSAPARVAGAGESYDQLLDRIVQADSRAWAFNRYVTGSMQIVAMQRDQRGNISVLRGNYRYGAPSLLGPSRGGTSMGWVEAHFVNGQLQCLQYHDRSSCIASTAGDYDEGMEAAREHHEYCEITHNC